MRTATIHLYVTSDRLMGGWVRRGCGACAPYGYAACKGDRGSGMENQ